jgi:hypothetical protein
VLICQGDGDVTYVHVKKIDINKLYSES